MTKRFNEQMLICDTCKKTDYCKFYSKELVAQVRQLQATMYNVVNEYALPVPMAWSGQCKFHDFDWNKVNQEFNAPPEPVGESDDFHPSEIDMEPAGAGCGATAAASF